VITNITAANDPGNLRSGPLPSAEISGDGKIFVVWEDCRFRSGCTTNDLVYTTSTNGSTWTAVARIPADPGGVSGTQDTFIPGVAVDRTTSGSSIKVGVGYYYYPNVNCTEATCQLDVGYISSSNGGSTWTAQTQLRGPMTIDWLPNTTQGRMVGDYISTSFSGGMATTVIAVGKQTTAAAFDEAMYSPGRLSVASVAQATRVASSAGTFGAVGTGETHHALKND
jgi:hypothetical protein